MKNGKNYRYLSLIILIIAVIMCIYGFLNGEAAAVHTKASKICMECIGLG